MKILNLHGLNGSSKNTNYRFLSEYFANKEDVEIVSPQLDYATHSPSTILAEIITACPNPDIIVGNSFGGFFAYIAAVYTGAKLLLINPCIPPHKYIKDLVPDYKYTDILKDLWNRYSNVHVQYDLLLGDNDTVLDIKTTLNNLKPENDRFKIISGGHSLSGAEYEKWFKEKLS